MTIFALFFCMQATGQCQLVTEAWRSFAPGPSTYATLGECQKMAVRMSRIEKPDEHGRYMMGLTGNPMWYECRSKPVETWQTEP